VTPSLLGKLTEKNLLLKRENERLKDQARLRDQEREQASQDYLLHLGRSFKLTAGEAGILKAAFLAGVGFGATGEKQWDLRPLLGRSST
jgi:hypothetical protein